LCLYTLSAASDGLKKEKKVKKRGTEDENPEDFTDPLTPDGDKKQLSSQMAKQYNRSIVEKSYEIFTLFCYFAHWWLLWY
jgi:valyl-tRNA synthetase